MIKLRLLTALALSATMLLPAGSALAQDDAEASPAADAPIAADDPRIGELQALVPPALAGLPLGDNLQVVTGEELMSVMQPDEAALMESMLEEAGKTTADYAAATTWLPITETDVAVIQAHRVAGIDASATIDAWVEILSLRLVEPNVAEGFIGGRPVTLVSDDSAPEVPLLHLFPARDVVWMMVTADQAIVEEAMDAVDADGADEEVEDEAEADETE